MNGGAAGSSTHAACVPPQQPLAVVLQLQATRVVLELQSVYDVQRTVICSDIEQQQQQQQMCVWPVGQAACSSRAAALLPKACPMLAPEPWRLRPPCQTGAAAAAAALHLWAIQASVPAGQASRMLQPCCCSSGIQAVRTHPTAPLPALLGSALPRALCPPAPAPCRPCLSSRTRSPSLRRSGR